MFSVGQTVLYGTNGVCRIEKITTRRVGSSEMEYYVLKPVRSDCSTVFVPTGNETLVSRMRFVKSADEVRAILDDRTFSIDWIDNKNLRAERFRGIISGEDCRELVARGDRADSRLKTRLTLPDRECFIFRQNLPETIYILVKE